jgi:hypothetical protein
MGRDDAMNGGESFLVGLGRREQQGVLAKQPKSCSSGLQTEKKCREATENLSEN